MSMARMLICCLLALGGCGPDREGFEALADMRPMRPHEDPYAEAPLGCVGEPCRDERSCPPDYRCIDGACVASTRACTSDLDCAGDTRCVRRACVAYDACVQLEPFRRACRDARFPGDAPLAPLAVRCQNAGWNSTSQPVIADLDGDARPEIIVQTFPSALLAVRADTCETVFRNQIALRSDGMGSVAVADLDLDRHPEIVAVDDQDRLVVFDGRGNVLAVATQPSLERNIYGHALWSAPAIAELDGMAPPEIVLGSLAARYVGPKAGGPRIDVLWSQESRTPPWGSLSVVADLDGDARPEVISSERIHDGLTGVDKTPRDLAALLPVPFHPQVADFSGDGMPDLLVIESRPEGQVVRVFDLRANRTIFGPYRAESGGVGGPAVIADFDGDGTPDFGLAGEKWLYAYALRCGAVPGTGDPSMLRPRGCTGHEPGLLWSRRIDDRSSGSAGVSAFDTNGDGAAEVFFRDECWLRILSGFSGRTLAAVNITSSTGLETPSVADVDGDGHAEVIVSSDVDIDLFGYCARANRPEADLQSPWLGYTRGLFVLSDPAKQFMPARSVWNQHSYHAANIRDDLSVPMREPAYWQSHNSFRMAQAGYDVPPGRERALPDLTGRIEAVQFPRDCTQAWTLAAQVCNRGAAPAAAPIFASFYDAPPDGVRAAICSARLDVPLSPGQCQRISCMWHSPPIATTRVVLRVADDGKMPRGAVEQCREDNDQDARADVTCFNAPP